MQSNVQVSKRPMTDAERVSVDSTYGLAQKGARTVGGIAIGFAVFSIFMGSLDDAEVGDMLSILFAVLLLVFGVLSLGITYSMFKLRKTIGEVQQAGYVITVRGPATKSTGTKNKMPWSVGPLALPETPVTEKVLQEGGVAEFVCVPKLKSVISINGAGLEQAINATISADLEAMVTSPSTPVSSPAGTSVNAAPQQPVSPPVTNTTNTGAVQRFCPSCGNPLTGTPFCAHCGHKL
jgi:hypothetical protein